MQSYDMKMLLSALSQTDVYPKALANFMFREIVEPLHTKYDISQEDMKEMCKQAVNRAAFYIMVQSDPKLYKAFGIQALGCNEWDDAELTEDLHRTYALLREFADACPDSPGNVEA